MAPYRRRWPTVRKGLRTTDAMLAGGWSSREPHDVYLQADVETFLSVVMHEAECRGTVD